ncbi:DEAD/DEAH box helicase [Aestuariispira insulae]|uniref:DEAD-box ATP-dependent RNA helicase RhpA n=1 Tax=Aestuariispira insulae TaxID=1461337 RepID=A0A3D9HNP8_9PROT|nr:DEAD/DEAH box helicase [Aestuariispira insulae]RED50931.1 superfamily II DNA/RNA helicase [Aestuariispira insulae]
MTVKFDDLGLGEDLLRAIGDAGYETPTPIQEKAIPFVLMNRDVLGCAQTGTGKTASFTLPMIDILSHGRARARMPRSVILAPTRELAAQVAENFETYGKYHKLNMALLIGGVSFGEQEKKLDRGVDVLIATPGRLLDHCERGKVMLTDTKIVVIDEADRMLDMGFIPDVERIVSMMPPLRQTVMFSATMPKEVRRLADKFLSNPKEVTVDKPSSTADTIVQGLAYVSPRQKGNVLRRWLDQDDVKNGIIFCNRKRDVATLYSSLKKREYPVGALHGDMDQYKRMECLTEFREGKITLLVCSDVAARGLDIASVSHVFNYDVPNNPEDYVHRIGRTGRAGRDGKAFTLATDRDDKLIRAIEHIIKKPIPVLEDFTKDKREEKSPDTKKESSSKDNRPSRDKERPARQSQKGRGRDRGRNRRDDDVVIGVEPESDLPFGQTDGVPAFLLRK